MRTSNGDGSINCTRMKLTITDNLRWVLLSNLLTIFIAWKSLSWSAFIKKRERESNEEHYLFFFFQFLSSSNLLFFCWEIILVTLSKYMSIWTYQRTDMLSWKNSNHRSNFFILRLNIFDGECVRAFCSQNTPRGMLKVDRCLHGDGNEIYGSMFDFWNGGLFCLTHLPGEYVKAVTNGVMVGECIISTCALIVVLCLLSCNSNRRM